MVSAATKTLLLDLETDRVLSVGQVARHYGLELSTIPTDAFIFDAFLAPTHHSMDYRRVRFVTLERKVTQLPTAPLRHLAGIAEMRRLLRAPREQWRSEAGTPFASGVPDALWSSSNGDIAIEYDAGSYSASKITSKALAYKRYKGQIWGSPSRRRVAHLTILLQEVGEFVPSMFAPWH